MKEFEYQEIRMKFSFEVPLNINHDDGNGIIHGTAHIHLNTFDDSELVKSEEVGIIEFVRLIPSSENAYNLPSMLDYTDDLGQYECAGSEEFLNGGEFYIDNLLIVKEAVIHSRFRGKGILASALDRLSESLGNDGTAVLLLPQPLQDVEHFKKLYGAYGLDFSGSKKKNIKKLEKYYSTLGFQKCHKEGRVMFKYPMSAREGSLLDLDDKQL